MTQSLFWRASRRRVLTGLLLWGAVTLIPLLIAPSLDGHYILGWPAGFALVAFVIPVCYLFIIGVYCLVMDRLEHQDQESGARTQRLDAQ